MLVVGSGSSCGDAPFTVWMWFVGSDFLEQIEVGFVTVIYHGAVNRRSSPAVVARMASESARPQTNPLVVPSSW